MNGTYITMVVCSAKWIPNGHPPSSREFPGGKEAHKETPNEPQNGCQEGVPQTRKGCVFLEDPGFLF